MKSKPKKVINQKRMESNIRGRLIIFAFLLMIFILSLTLVMRMVNDKPLFPVGESYYNLRIAQALKQDFLLTRDLVQETVYHPNPYHYLLAFLFMLLPVETVSLFFPLILGLLCGLLFFKLLLLLRVKYRQAAYSLFVLAVTPVFIVLFTQLIVHSFVVLLSLLALVLALYDKPENRVLAVLVFLLLALTSLIGFLITLVILLILCLVLKKKIMVIILSLITPLLVFVSLITFSNYTPRLLGFHSFAFKNILSILKAGFGFDLFLVLLFLAGFLAVWIKQKEKKFFHLATLVLFVFSFFNTTARIFASFLITVYCVIAIMYLYKRKWSLNIICMGTLLLVLCSLVFSATNQINLLVNAQPNKEMQEVLLFLRDLDKGRVLTLEENGFLVEYYSEKRVLLNSNSLISPEYPDVKKDSDALFESARLVDAQPLFETYNLRYVLITPQMKEELWENREQGLWFLVMHSESFIKKHRESGFEIWEYAKIDELNEMNNETN